MNPWHLFVAAVVLLAAYDIVSTILANARRARATRLSKERYQARAQERDAARRKAELLPRSEGRYAPRPYSQVRVIERRISQEVKP